MVTRVYPIRSVLSVAIAAPHKCSNATFETVFLRRTFETRPTWRNRSAMGPSATCLICGLFRDSVQFCSGLVDLVVGVGHHGGGGHRLTLAGERFVGLVAEDIAEVGDRGGDFGDRRRGEGTEGETGDGGRRFVASEPVEKSGEDGQRDADRGGVARSRGSCGSPE